MEPDDDRRRTRPGRPEDAERARPPGALSGRLAAPAAVLAAGLALVLAATAPVQAQDRGTWSVLPRGVLELRAGAASPRGTLGDVADGGEMYAASLSYRLLPRLALGVEGALSDLSRGGDPALTGGAAGADVELWHYLAVVSLELTDPVRSRWEFVLHGAAGGTRIEGDATETLPAVGESEGTLGLAVDGGYDVSDDVTVFVRADGYALLGDDEAERPYPGSDLVLTHTAGVRIGL